LSPDRRSIDTTQGVRNAVEEDPMCRPIIRALAGLLALVALSATPALANPPGENG
jgi:hypothetical protein